MIISDKHFFLTTSSELKELIKPLKKYGIDYFTYNKNYKNGERIRLTTHPLHLKAFLENKFYETGNIDAEPDLYLNQAAIFATLKNQKLVEWIRSDFRVYHGVYIVRKSEHYTEFFSFATSTDNPLIIDFYLNNLNLLQQFCDSFLEQAKPLILQAEKNKLIHEYHHDSGIIQCQFVNDERKELTPGILSSRQIEVIEWLLIGYRAKEIAKKMNISPRTVEEHIANLKSIFQARNIIELIVRLKLYF